MKDKEVAILKFIEEPDSVKPKAEDLVKEPVYWESGLRGYKLTVAKEGQKFLPATRVLKPYGVSENEEPQKGDTVLYHYREETWIVEEDFQGCEDNIKHCFKKVLIKPEEFNGEDLIELDLKEGDKFNSYGKKADGKVFITA